MKIKFQTYFTNGDFVVERAILNPHKLYRVNADIYTSLNEALMCQPVEESA